MIVRERHALPFRLDLSLFVRAEDAMESARVADLVAKSRPMFIRENEPYWKDPSLRRVITTLELTSLAPGPALVEGLSLLAALATRWYVQAPVDHFDDGTFSVNAEVVATSILIPALADAFCTIRNHDQRPRRPEGPST